MQFTIDGGAPPPTGIIPPGLRKVIDLLDALPDGALLTAPNVTARAGVNRAYLAHWSAHPEIKARVVRRAPSLGNLYGNPATIEAYVKAHS